MKYDKKDVPQFIEDECKQWCSCWEHEFGRGGCKKEYWENGNTHWFLMCPRFFNWKLGIVTEYRKQQIFEKEHPEEAAAKKAKRIENAKIWAEKKKQIAKEKRKNKSTKC